MINICELGKDFTDVSDSEMKSLSGGALGFLTGVSIGTANVIYDNLTGASPNTTVTNLGKTVLGTGITTGLGLAFLGPKGAGLAD